MPASLPPDSDQNPHDRVRTLEACIRQLEQFLRPDGKVVHTCDGACDPE